MAWEIRLAPTGVDIFDNENNTTICTIHHDPCNPGFAKARAMLIVQAPRLFNNLSDIVSHAERLFPPTLDSHLRECKSSLSAVSQEQT